jgi:hypothetical protein
MRACELATLLFYYYLMVAAGHLFQESAQKKRARGPLSLTVSVSIILDAQPHSTPLDHEKISPNAWNNRPPELPIGHAVIVLHPFAMQCLSLRSINRHHS